MHAVLHAIGDNTVHRAEQSIKETGYPQVVLCKLEVGIVEGMDLEMLVGLSVISHYCRHLLGNEKVLVSLPILGSQGAATIEFAFQFVDVHTRHVQCYPVGDALELWFSPRQFFTPVVHYLSVCNQYLHICYLLSYCKSFFSLHYTKLRLLNRVNRTKLRLSDMRILHQIEIIDVAKVQYIS